MGGVYLPCDAEREEIMAQYIMRLDDAAPHADWNKWMRMEELLDKYQIRPLAGVIPDCRDPVINQLEERADFWQKVSGWEKKGWTIAMHGYDHVYITSDGGMHPVNQKSEFAGVPFAVQRQKIREGITVFKKHGIHPKVFFAPSHTMDLNTVKALKQVSEICFISDTIANAPYRKWGMTFVPQQTGRARELPLKVVTFCYHPNVMEEDDFIYLENFFKKWKNRFISFPLEPVHRRKTVYDWMLGKIYYRIRQK